MRNQLSKIVFPEVFSLGHVSYSFQKRAVNFPLKGQVYLLKVQKKTKKNSFSKPFLHNFPSVQVDYCLDTPGVFIWQAPKKVAGASNLVQKNKTSLEKEMIFRKIFLLKRGCQLRQPWKKLPEKKVSNFWLKVQRGLKHCL